MFLFVFDFFLPLGKKNAISHNFNKIKMQIMGHNINSYTYEE